MALSEFPQTEPETKAWGQVLSVGTDLGKQEQVSRQEDSREEKQP